MEFSRRIQNLQASPIRKFIPMVDRVEAEGVDVIRLNIGQPDIPTPPDFLEAVRAYDVDVLEYQNSRGMKRTLETTQLYLHNYGLDFDLDEICITNGASEGIAMAVTVLCNPGDAILAMEPFYTSYNAFAQAQEVEIVPVRTYAEDGFVVPPLEAWDAAIEASGKKDKLRAFLLSSPANPTGRVYSEDEMRIIMQVVQKYDLWLIADEVYREFNYTDRPFHSFAEYPEIADRTILVDSISKKYSACGARIGSLASKNKAFNDYVLKLCQSRLCVSTLDQIGAGAMDNVDDAYVEHNRKVYKQRRDALRKRLNQLDGVVAPEPEGAFYIVIKLPVDNAETFILWMLEHFRKDGKTLLMTPAAAFYATPDMGLDEVRVSYCVAEERLMEAMDILEEALKAYPGRKTV
ncbi:MAG: pyridoxal phosphate-dependent aminotransferase [Peptoniphilaceae bacterium]|nr:pyridoxal phosphate-dependent aminotransferase [Peptoniphilaceae bacterium]MDY6086048.1 pyridoxal phosphate-dependent aminotransferase [Peptoniphilaceae bacterium]